MATEKLPSQERRIDIWWWGDKTSRLMLLFAYLMTRNEAWNEAKIRVLAAGHENGSGETVEGLQKIFQEVRIEAEAEIVKDADIHDVVAYSGDSALVFVPFQLHSKQLLGPFGSQVDDLNRSRAQLQQLINRLNRKSREKAAHTPGGIVRLFFFMNPFSVCQ